MRKVVCILLLLPITSLYALLAIVSCLISRRTLPTLIMRAWAKTLLLIYGIKINITGSQHVDIKKPALYMSNHSTILDIPVLIASLPVDLRFIFKQSLIFFPFVGQAIYLMGMVPIDRSSRQKASRSLKKAGERIRNGIHVLIFPEGTRSKTADMLPFKKGGFVLATQESVDIVPISIVNAKALAGRNSVWVHSGTLEIHIHPRVCTHPYSLDQRAELLSLVRQTIHSRLGKPYSRNARLAAKL